MAINTAPTLDPSINFTDSVNEDQTTTGVPGTYFVNHTFSPSTDIDGDSIGIAVVGVSGLAGGTSEISTDGGTTWVPVSGTISNTSALLLKATDLFRYTPPLNESGDRVITFHAWDGTGGYASGSFVDISALQGGSNPFSVDAATHTLTVVPVNDAPVAFSDSVGAIENGSVVSGNLVATDVDSGAALTYSLNGTVDGLTIDTDGSYSFDAVNYDSLAAGVTQNVVATYTVTDDHGATDTATLTITVTGVNDAPVAVSDSIGATENGSVVSGNVVAVDADSGAALTYSLDGTVDGLTIATDGSYSFDAASYDSLAAGVTQEITASYTVSDDQGATDTATLTITVTGVNDAPVAVDDSIATTEDGSIVTGSLVASDVDSGTTLTYSLSNSVDGLTINGDGGYSFDTSAYDSMLAGASQTVVATYTVTDDEGATDVATLTITVAGINDAPVLDVSLDRFAAIDEDSTGIPVNGNYFVKGFLSPDLVNLVDGASFDAEGSALGIAITGVSGVTDGTVEISTDGGASWTPVTDPVSDDHALLLSATDLLRYTPPLNENGDRVITFHAWDGTGGYATGDYVDITSLQGGSNPFSTDAATHTLTINPVNDAPEAVADINEEIAVENGDPISGSVADNDTDIDSTSLTYSLNGTFNGLTIETDGSYVFDPIAFDGVGEGVTQDFTATYTVVDDSGASSEATLTITVTGSNDAPTLAGGLSFTDSAEASIPPPIGIPGSYFINHLFPFESSYDVDGDPMGIAITDVSGVVGGKVQISTDGGVSWKTVTESVSETNALLLSATDLLRYTPPSTLGDRVITFHAWDGTGGYTSGTYADLTGLTGGTAPFSVETGTHTLTIVNIVNNEPILANSIVDQFASQGKLFTYTLPDSTFHDFDTATLTYTATQEDGSALPSWLKFNAQTKTFSGTPGNADLADISIKVTANDGTSNVSDVFNLSARPSFSYDAVLRVSDSAYDLVGNEDYSIDARQAEHDVRVALTAESDKIDLLTLDANLVANQSGLNAKKTEYKEVYQDGDDKVTVLVKGTSLGKIFGQELTKGTASISSVSFSYPNDEISFSLTTSKALTLDFTKGSVTGKFTGMQFSTPWLAIKAVGTFDVSGTQLKLDAKNFALNAKLTELSVAYPQDDYKVLLKGAIAYSQTASGFATYSGSLTEFQVQSPFSDLIYKGNLSVSGNSNGNPAFTGQVSEISVTGIDNTFVFKGNINFSADGTLSGVITDLQFDVNGEHYVATGLNANVLTLFNADGTPKDVNADGSIDLHDLQAFVLAGNDFVLGSVNSDDLNGGSGADYIDGGSGYDLLTGGHGADTFVLHLGSSAVITDFNASEGDTLDLSQIDGIDATDVSFQSDGYGSTLVFVDAGEGAEQIATLMGVDSVDTASYILDGPNYVNAADLIANKADKLDGTEGIDVINGGAGADVMTGNGGNDIYFVDNAKDVVVEADGGGDADEVRSSVSYKLGDFVENLTLIGKGVSNISATGNALDNVIIGDTGNNLIDGGAGDDTMIGGYGDDTYILDSANDVVTEYAEQGVDTVKLNFTPVDPYQLSSGVENAVLGLAGAAELDGNELNNYLIGNAGADTLVGGEGNNTLDGGLGADSLVGGFGNDTFVIDVLGDAGDSISDEGGVDTVVAKISSGSYALGDGMENLILFGSAKLTALGNDANNVIHGNDGANVIDGGAGADTADGGKGDDVYYVNAQVDEFGIGDVVSEVIGGKAGGNDKVISTAASFTLGDNIETLILSEDTDVLDINGIGNAIANTITGNSGANYLEGGGGVDNLTGGAGSDTYMVNVIKSGAKVVMEDKLTEKADLVDGEDTSFDMVLLQGQVDVAKASTISVGNNFEGLDASLTGTTKLNLTGNARDNTLVGNAADNILDGGKGIDLMSGGLGNDTYMVDQVDDQVSEYFDEGNDTVKINITGVFDEGANQYTLGTDIENGILANTIAFNLNGNELANILVGNAKANELYGFEGDDSLSGAAGVDILDGGDGNDTLDGGAGADSMDGAEGSDVYIVDNAKDEILDSGSGPDDIDVIQTTLAKFTLSELQSGIEKIIAIGTAASSITGNDDANDIVGNGKNNTLIGGLGSDTLDGGLGADKLTGGDDADIFLFSTVASAKNADTITDFSEDQGDLIHLDARVFTVFADMFVNLGLTYSADNFKTQTEINGIKATVDTDAVDPVPQDEDDYLIYDDKAGKLYYDSNAGAAGGRVLIATLAKTSQEIGTNDNGDPIFKLLPPTLVATDIEIVGLPEDPGFII